MDPIEWTRLSREGDESWDDVVQRLVDLIDEQSDLVKWLNLDAALMKRALVDFLALPNSTALLTAGTKRFMGMNCFVTVPDDSMESIGSTLTKSSINAGLGGGNGYSFDRLRSRKEPVRGISGHTGGPVSFMKGYSNYMAEVSAGLARSAACMGTLTCDHLDVLEFVRCKDPKHTPAAKDPKYMSHFNISVGLTDKFMRAAKEGQNFTLRGRSTDITEEISADDLLDEIAESISRSGDPGIFFIDRVNYLFPGAQDYKRITGHYLIEALNVCGETLLPNNGACMLGSINLPRLYAMSDDENQFYQILMATTEGLLHLLTLIMYCQSYPHEEQRLIQLHNRQVGIGYAGLATAMALAGIKYSSEEAVRFTKDVYYWLETATRSASMTLYELNESKTRVTGYHWEKPWKGNMSYIPLTPYQAMNRVFHTTRMAQAPTSSLSRIFNDVNNVGCSYGIEPYFAKEETIHSEMYGTFTRTIKLLDVYSELEDVVEYANQITPEQQIAVMAAAQKYIDMAVSKTIGLPRGVSPEKIREYILLSYESKLKGITFYPDGCRGSFISTTRKRRRPKTLPCKIHTTKVRGEAWAVIVGFKDDNLFEVFAGLQKDLGVPSGVTEGHVIKRGSGHYELTYENGKQRTIKDIISTAQNPACQVITRMVSLALQSNAPVSRIVKTLQKDGSIVDFNRAIARILNKYSDPISKDNCPNCDGGSLIAADGCVTCTKCGWSRCM
jgi:ribonucleoside-diphosphate reductase alpha chain